MGMVCGAEIEAERDIERVREADRERERERESGEVAKPQPSWPPSSCSVAGGWQGAFHTGMNIHLAQDTLLNNFMKMCVCVCVSVCPHVCVCMCVGMGMGQKVC